MFVRDIRRTGEHRDKKFPPPMPRVYLYPEVRALFPILPSVSVATLEQSVAKIYRAKRYEVVRTLTASLPSFRYPTPYLVPKKSWSIAIEGESPVVDVRIGETRCKLRFKGGGRYRRQLAAVRQIVEGAAVPGQLDLYQSGDELMCTCLPAISCSRSQTPA